MTTRVRQAALRIRLLMEEFSSQELSKAVTLLGGQPEEDLLHFLNRIKAEIAERRSSQGHSGKGGKASSGLESIRAADPEKYQLLKEFEVQLGDGERLRTLHDVRVFGQMLDKGFEPGKSRTEGVSRLLKMLAALTLVDLRAVVRQAPRSDVEESDAFLRLSRHIISGAKDSQSQADQIE